MKEFLPSPPPADPKPPKPVTGSLTKEFYKARELANILGVNVDTINRWVRKGFLRAYKLKGSAGHLFRVDHVNEFLNANEVPHSRS